MWAAPWLPAEEGYGSAHLVELQFSRSQQVGCDLGAMALQVCESLVPTSEQNDYISVPTNLGLRGHVPRRGVSDLHRVAGQRVVSDYCREQCRCCYLRPRSGCGDEQVREAQVGEDGIDAADPCVGASRPRLLSGAVPVIGASCVVLPSVSEGMA
jgi:hypothetical protein